jgi:DNA-binding IclR family transcriptional regulator
VITLRDQVIGFFLRSPEEALTRCDIVARWDVNAGTARDSLQTLLGDGLLRRELAGREYVYTPTPTLLALGDAA